MNLFKCLCKIGIDQVAQTVIESSFKHLQGKNAFLFNYNFFFLKVLEYHIMQQLVCTHVEFLIFRRIIDTVFETWVY